MSDKANGPNIHTLGEVKSRFEELIDRLNEMRASL